MAWFLSLVVMLLVVLRRTKEGASEYRRGGKSSSKLHEGIAWQAWVSDQASWKKTFQEVEEKQRQSETIQ